MRYGIVSKKVPLYGGEMRIFMIDILYRDRDIIVCVKPVGVLSQEGEGCTMPALLREQTGCHYVAAVHRLDLTTGGVMVYACSERAAKELSRLITAGELQKQYLAIIHGSMEEENGTLRDLLFHDKRLNKSYVVPKERHGTREALLSYRTLAVCENTSLLAVALHTGRTHQIRVQFASRRHPLLGDRKYGARDHFPTIALWSHRLSFLHPFSKESLTFVSPMPRTAPWDMFSETATTEIR